MKLLIVVNSPDFFLSHRLPVALAAREHGYDVHIATGAGNAGQKISDLGFKFHALELSRSGRNVFLEARSFFLILRLFLRLRPNLVHLVTIKPVLYGGLAARLARISGVVAAISGLGSVFVDRGHRRSALPVLLKILFRVSLGGENTHMIFQNEDDQAEFLKFLPLSRERCHIIRGSGVNLSDYPVVAEPTGVPVVTFAARLLEDKGIRFFVDAARLLKDRGVKARFVVAGERDPENPTSVSELDICLWSNLGYVEFIGFQNDIPKLFSESNIIVLPSYYREGLPKVLIEAAACGRAVITTNSVGCRDAIVPDETGLLVPVQNSVELANAIERLIENPTKRQKFGLYGRKLAEANFCIEKVVKSHLEIYRLLACPLKSGLP